MDVVQRHKVAAIAQSNGMRQRSFERSLTNCDLIANQERSQIVSGLSKSREGNKKMCDGSAGGLREKEGRLLPIRGCSLTIDAK